MNKIAELRKERKLSQKKLGSIIGVAQNTVCNWEAGNREPDVDSIGRLADYFGVTTDYLLGKSRFRNPQEMIDYWGVVGDPYFEANFDFGDLVRQEREKQGLTLAEMAAELGITSQDAADCEDGVLPINRELADKMATFLGTNVSQMLFDYDLYPEEVPEAYHDNVAEWERLSEQAEEEAARETAEMRTSTLPPNAIPIDFSKWHQIPILGRISAGLPIYAEEHIEGYTLTDLNGGAEYFALRVHGDSMNAIGINDGYLIVVRRQDEVEQGEIAIVLVGDDDATVKRFYATNSTVTLMPQSTNPIHGPQIYDLRSTPVKVLGKVIEVKFTL